MLALAHVESALGEWKTARAHLELAQESTLDGTGARAATWHQLATIDLREGDHAAAREKFDRSLKIKQAIGDRAGEAATWHQLATIDLNEGDYAAAREKFDRSLKIKQAIGDRAGEAATWHQLASIDIEEGDYAAARKKLGRSLKIEQEIGNRAGEAATFFQLGVVAHRIGRGHLGARLAAICWLIDRSIGHGDAESDLRALSGLCSELGYDQAQFEGMVAEALEAYETNRGRALIERAFPEDEKP